MPPPEAEGRAVLRCCLRREGGAQRRAAFLLEIYNSLTRRLEPFEPIEPGVAKMYVCGITPYDVGHLGHALVFVTFDVVRRYLEFNSYEVRHIQNITDIDDDMVRKSRELGISIPELTDRNHSIYLHEMDALNVQRPLAYPRVSQSLPEIIELVQLLIARGHAYVVDGYVFFDSASCSDFGRLSGRTREELRQGPISDSTPEEPDHLKRDRLDFLLWQPSDAPDARFPSPWGEGRPGWHIECSAMARAALGDRIDIHGGGRDLQYPHHDSEIVQSECATGEAPYVQTWMHVGTMKLDGVKMSKSLGNLVKVSDLLADGHSPDAIRLNLLRTHYRADHDWDAEELRRSEKMATALRRAVNSAGGPPDRLRVQPRRLQFMEAMDDDFNTPRAVDVLLSIAADIEAARLDGETAIPTLIELADVLGLRLGREG